MAGALMERNDPAEPVRKLTASLLSGCDMAQYTRCARPRRTRYRRRRYRDKLRLARNQVQCVYAVFNDFGHTARSASLRLRWNLHRISYHARGLTHELPIFAERRS
jgi:hypothetical protein